jgi:hypothetical protein
MWVLDFSSSYFKKKRKIKYLIKRLEYYHSSFIDARKTEGDRDMREFFKDKFDEYSSLLERSPTLQTFYMQTLRNLYYLNPTRIAAADSYYALWLLKFYANKMYNTRYKIPKAFDGITTNRLYKIETELENIMPNICLFLISLLIFASIIHSMYILLRLI